MTTLNDLLEQYGALSFEKQLALGDLIGDRNWQVEMSRGTIMFGNDLEFPIQILGTEAEDAQTWLWAWANYESDIPPALLKCSNAMQHLGTSEQIVELTTPEVSLQKADGHTLSMIASGVCNASAYYRGPYQGGAVFMLIDAPSLALTVPPAPTGIPRMITSFMQFISAVPVNHKRAFAAYASARGLAVSTLDGGLSAGVGNSRLDASFDSLDRLTNMHSTIAPR